MEPDSRIWKSYVWHNGKCWFVSTIERDYDTAAGHMRGQETLVWEYDYDKHERGHIVYQGGNIADHHRACRCLILDGEIPEEDSELWQRFK